MTDRISDLPRDEQPSRRLDLHGPETLSDAELIAVLLGCTTMAEARTITANGLRSLPKGISTAKRQRYAAAIELNARLSRHDGAERWTASPASFGRALVARLGNEKSERLGAYALNSRNQVLGSKDIFFGTINTAKVSTRDVVRYALEMNATAIVIYHNHPSGDPTPSYDDTMFTTTLTQALRLVDIELADHIIAGSHRYYSMKERGLL